MDRLSQPTTWFSILPRSTLGVHSAIVTLHSKAFTQASLPLVVWFGCRRSLGKLSGVAQTFTVGGYVIDSSSFAHLLGSRWHQVCRWTSTCRPPAPEVSTNYATCNAFFGHWMVPRWQHWSTHSSPAASTILSVLIVHKYLRLKLGTIMRW
jgi:hypothetical protein